MNDYQLTSFTNEPLQSNPTMTRVLRHSFRKYYIAENVFKKYLCSKAFIFLRHSVLKKKKGVIPDVNPTAIVHSEI